MATPDSESFVRTFARGLRVIEVMGQGLSRKNIAEISELAELPRTVVRRLLLTLADLGFVRTDSRLYWLTPKVLRLGLTYLYTLPFWQQSQLVREQGYAWVDGELDESICGLAVPVREQDGSVVAALNVSLISGQYSEETAVAKYLPLLRLATSRLRSAG
ncbi:MAG: helix-turn-helix domain-containing protein [Burkholderiaceae bacterium]